jgi:hypothetical protein
MIHVPVPYRFWCVIPLSNALKCYSLRAFATPPNLGYILYLISLYANWQSERAPESHP